MSRWFRHYAGMMSDPKFGGVARFCKRSRAEVLFVWGCLLESASEYDSAVYSWDADAIAEMLAIETDQAQAIHDALEAKGLIASGKICSWDRRQFKSDDSAERVRKHRASKKSVSNQHNNDTVTIGNGDVTPPETETETERSTSVANAPEVSSIPKNSARNPMKGAFERFWSGYPLKVGKRKAEAAYDRAWRRCETDDPEAEIRDGLKRCAPLWEPEFIPHPTTWLNRDGWLDQLIPDLPDGTGPPRFDLAKHEAWQRRVVELEAEGNA